MKLEFDEFKFVYISLDYLKAMHEIDKEIFYVNSPEYEKKPHLGIMVNCDNIKYVIPLTSAKAKHKTWDDVTATNYIIFEIINKDEVKIDEDDIITTIKNTELLHQRNIEVKDYHKYRKRLLAVLEIKKMFPVKEGVYTYVNMDRNESDLSKEELDRRGLMHKEYRFCLRIKDGIEKRANKIYIKQIKTNKVLPFHCNFKKLENAMKMY